MVDVSNRPSRGLSDVELRDRQDDLEKALKLFGSVSNRLSEATPILEAALVDADHFRRMCEKNPALRAAMVSRRLAIKAIIQDIRNVSSKTSSVTKSVGKSLQTKRNELEEAIRDPELLR